MSHVLESVNKPQDLRTLSPKQLKQLAAEIRGVLLNTVLQTGGHLASNLGVVELTIALHATFDSPRDKIVWDVGHQSYVHKLLTGRRDRFLSMRQYGGLCGFPDRRESEHDPFGAGHASTAVSAALGLAVARDLKGENHHVVAVVGDGAMSGGLSFEGVNNAGHIDTRLIVILNDNGMSIAPNVGALAHYMDTLRTDPRYTQAKAGFEQFANRMPLGKLVLEAFRRFKLSVKGLVIPTLIWEELGFTYLGPVDGHDVGALRSALERAKLMPSPTLVHVITVKGKGYDPAEDDAESFHGVAPNGTKRGPAPSYSKVFGNTLMKLAKQDDRVVAITAAMADGTGLSAFAKEFPKRFFDVGIAEEHAVTFAAGMASQGMHPVVAVYSTFLQRAYDQILHDVCIQNLPVVFGVDRAGLVGDDGDTHQGAFDLSFLRHIPNMVLMAPKDENELQHMLYTATQLRRPCAIRYPRGSGVGVPMDEELHQIPVGCAETLRWGSDVAILAVGNLVQLALAAADALALNHVETEVVNLRFVKPLDVTQLHDIASRHDLILTLEENVLQGGMGSAVLEALESIGPTRAKVVRLGLPDCFIEHGNAGILRSKYGLSLQTILETIDKEHTGLRHRLRQEIQKAVGGSVG